MSSITTNSSVVTDTTTNYHDVSTIVGLAIGCVIITLIIPCVCYYLDRRFKFCSRCCKRKKRSTSLSIENYDAATIQTSFQRIPIHNSTFRDHVKPIDQICELSTEISKPRSIPYLAKKKSNEIVPKSQLKQQQNQPNYLHITFDNERLPITPSALPIPSENHQHMDDSIQTRSSKEMLDRYSPNETEWHPSHISSRRSTPSDLSILSENHQYKDDSIRTRSSKEIIDRYSSDETERHPSHISSRRSTPSDLSIPSENHQYMDDSIQTRSSKEMLDRYSPNETEWHPSPILHRLFTHFALPIPSENHQYMDDSIQTPSSKEILDRYSPNETERDPSPILHRLFTHFALPIPSENHQYMDDSIQTRSSEEILDRYSPDETERHPSHISSRLSTPYALSIPSKNHQYMDDSIQTRSSEVILDRYSPNETERDPWHSSSRRSTPSALPIPSKNHQYMDDSIQTRSSEEILDRYSPNETERDPWHSSSRLSTPSALSIPSKNHQYMDDSIQTRSSEEILDRYSPNETERDPSPILHRRSLTPSMYTEDDSDIDIPVHKHTEPFNRSKSADYLSIRDRSKKAGSSDDVRYIAGAISKPDKMKSDDQCPQVICKQYSIDLGMNRVYFNFDHNRCYCSQCYPSTKADYFTVANSNYTVPRGWVRFGLQIDQTFADTKQIFKRWYTTFYGTSKDKVESIINNRFIPVPGDRLLSGEIFTTHLSDKHHVYTSPSIHYACLRHLCRNDTMKIHNTWYDFQIVLECKQNPEGIIKQRGCEHNVCRIISDAEIEWKTDQRSSIVPYGLLIRTRKHRCMDSCSDRHSLKDPIDRSPGSLLKSPPTPIFDPLPDKSSAHIKRKADALSTAAVVKHRRTPAISYRSDASDPDRRHSYTPERIYRSLDQCPQIICKQYSIDLGMNRVYFNFDHNRCYCSQCYPSTKTDYFTVANSNYTVPRGWVRFGLNIDQTFADTQQIFKRWCTTFYGTSKDKVESIIENRFIPFPGDPLLSGKIFTTHLSDKHHVYTSPSIHYACLRHLCRNDTMKIHNTWYDFQIVLECKQNPEGIIKQRGCEHNVCRIISDAEIEWKTDQRSSIVPYGLLIRTRKHRCIDKCSDRHS